VNGTKILLKYANENCAGNDNMRSTPLIYAAQTGHVEVVRVLLEGGANAESANVDQWNTLHYAAMNGHLDVCRLLLDWGVNVNCLNKRKYTPLHYAAWAGYLSVAKLLVERGADVRLKNYNGQTSSDVARMQERIDVAEWLDSLNRG
jgi:ankyrin repeat protein